jgi:DNA modification methylase
MIQKTKKYVIINIQKIATNKEDVFRYIGHYSDRIHEIIIWNKSVAQPTGTKHKISNKYEFIIIMYAQGNKKKKVDIQSEFMWNVFDDGGRTKNKYANIHKAVMNKNVSDFVIKEFTSPNDLVMDCFSGMATTGVSCLEQGRRYMGIELNKIYYDESIKRLQETQ